MYSSPQPFQFLFVHQTNTKATDRELGAFPTIHTALIVEAFSQQVRQNYATTANRHSGFFQDETASQKHYRAKWKRQKFRHKLFEWQPMMDQSAWEKNCERNKRNRSCQFRETMGNPFGRFQSGSSRSGESSAR